MLHLRGSISTKKLWDEFKKDNELEDREMIKSRNHMKERILHTMQKQGKIVKAPAQDIVGFKSSGW